MADYRLWPATNGPEGEYSDGSDYTLGLEFYSTATAWVTRIWFWYPPGPTNPNTITSAKARLWRVDTASAGTALGVVENLPNTGTGWQSVALAAPIQITANQRYRAVVYTQNTSGSSSLGRTTGYWTSGGPGATGRANGPLTAPNTTGATGNDQCSYSSSATAPSYPTLSNENANYWVDVTITDVDPAGGSEEFVTTASLDLDANASFPSYASSADVAAALDLDTTTIASHGSSPAPTASLDLDSAALLIHLPVASMMLGSTAVAAYQVTLTPTASLRLRSTGAVLYAFTTTVTAPLDLESRVSLFQPGGGGGRGLLVHDLYYVERQPPPDLRVIAQRILTGEWLDWDVPLTGIDITHTLSGPQVITGRLDAQDQYFVDTGTTPEQYAHAIGLEPMACYLHVEEDGNITATGLLQPLRPDGQNLTVEAFGVSSYPHRKHYGGVYSRIGVDPLDVVREIWSHVQSAPQGDIGVRVGTTTSPVRLGTEPRDVEFETGDGEQVSFTADGPYELAWFANVDCGAEIDELAEQTPFDYLEHNHWDSPAKTAVVHDLRLGYPRLGRKRFDLTFAQDENLLAVVPHTERAGGYVSQVVVLGAGEGSAMVRGYAGRRVGNRVRETVVITDKSITTTARANSVAGDELRRRQASLFEIAEILVDARDDNARFGSYQPGDDILIEADIPWVGEIRQWHRIVAYTYTPRGDTVSIALKPSESFNYGAVA